MLMLVCVCGHSAPFPTEEGGVQCSKCKRRHLLQWHDEDAWRTRQVRRNLARSNPPVEWRAEWTSAASTTPQARPEGASQH